MRKLINGKSELGIKQMYEFYKSSVLNPVSYSEYKEITSFYIDEMMDLIINEAHSFQLPARMGVFRIRKTRVNYNNLAIDWEVFNKEGIIAYHLNQHSDGFRVKFHWEKKSALLKPNTKRPYSFTLSRDWKRYIAQKMKKKDGHSLYPAEIVHYQNQSS